MDNSDLPSTKPYLIRAIWEWCNDNGFTPYLAVTVDQWTRVPREAVRDGQIVLNVGSEATNRLDLGNDEIQFQARFNGVARDIVVPVHAVSAIYARENGAGMAFEVEAPKISASSSEPDGMSAHEDVAEPPESSAASPNKKPSHLQRIK